VKRGQFVTFEGGEGAGKSTLVSSLATYFKAKGVSVLVTREPGGTPLGERVRSWLLDPAIGKVAPETELALFLASRSENVHTVIAPALEQGKLVLCDRFNDSSVAYQGHARGLGIDVVEEVSSFFCRGLIPDLTLYLDIDPVRGLARRKQVSSVDRMEQEETSFHECLRQGYLEIARRHQDRFVILNAERSAESLLREALRILHQQLHIEMPHAMG
jgi:dTMP kinase